MINRKLRICAAVVLAAALAAASLMLSSCGARGPGFGVVLWSNDDAAIKTGAVVRVVSQSKYTKSYLVALPDSRKELTMAMWRVRVVGAQNEAERIAASYKPFIASYAQAVGAGVAIRSAPDPNSQRIYRLRDGQRLKIIGREPIPGTVGGQSDYWYQVLTEDGANGYCFGSSLTLLGEGATQAQAGAGLLRIVLGETFRPMYFKDMIASGHIDLTRFDPQFGFFIDTAAKSLRIVLPKSTESFTYTSVQEQGGGDYAFAGTPVVLSIISPSEIRLRYADVTGKSVDSRFVAMSDQEVAKQVKMELDRRKLIYERFLKGGRFASDYYGQIDFAADFAFTWKGYSRLVPAVVPLDAGTVGTVDFNLTISDTIIGEYDGAVTFKFASPNGLQPVSFLYTFVRGGLKLVYVPQSAITDSVVTETPSTPLVVFFSAAG